MTPLTETFTLQNGDTIPRIGFGTWQIPNGKQAYDATAAALAAGYRHVDTARDYGNEESVSRAIADSGLARDEIYLTTKLPAAIKDYDGARASFETTMDALGLDHVNLYLIHAPWPWEDQGSDHAAGNAEVWRAMEEIRKDGRAKAIGVSNFSISDIQKLVDASGVTPQVNQIRFFIGSSQPDVTAYCQSNGILVEAYSPLATGHILDNGDIAAVAGKYGKTVAQVCIRYALQKGALPLPKTVTPARMAENADVDFQISDEDMATLDGLE